MTGHRGDCICAETGEVIDHTKATGPHHLGICPLWRLTTDAI